MYEHVAGRGAGSVDRHYAEQFNTDLWYMEFHCVGTTSHMHHQSHILQKCIQ